jgi:pimeloyl-ACP methyl ester carboxylesterase
VSIEVIDKGCSTPAHPAPLLFVHGAFMGAWCWDEHFLDYFADRGYRALALGVRGHGDSPANRSLHRCSIADYVEDLCAVADLLPEPPVLIGHSMGGYVVQRYLRVRSAPAAVLLASVPRKFARTEHRHGSAAAQNQCRWCGYASVGYRCRTRQFS